MRLLFSFIILFISGISSEMLHAQDHIDQQLSFLLEKNLKVDLDQTTSFIVSLIEHDTIVYKQFNDKNGHIPLDSTSIFEVGSITKFFVNEFFSDPINKIDLATPLEKNAAIPSNLEAEQMTIDHLLKHQTTFQKYPPNMGRFERNPSQPFEHYPTSALCSLLDTTSSPIAFPDFNYSHTNYCLLEAWYNRDHPSHFQTKFNSYLSQIGMKNSWIGNDNLDRVAEGYNRANRPAQPLLYQSCAASEGMKTTMEDLSVLIQKILHNSDKFGNHKEAVDVPWEKHLKYAHPWMIMKIKKDRYLYILTGRTNLHRCQIVCDPQTKTAAIVINTGENKIDTLVMEIIEMMNDYWTRKK